MMPLIVSQILVGLLLGVFYGLLGMMALLVLETASDGFSVPNDDYEFAAMVLVWPVVLFFVSIPLLLSIPRHLAGVAHGMVKVAMRGFK